jgi:hypothetical protein
MRHEIDLVPTRVNNDLARRSVVGLSATICWLCLLLSCVTANAQLSAARVTGVVRDTSGAVIPGVNITLQNLDTSIRRQSVSNATGNYVFDNVTPGNYALTAAASRFEKLQIPTITLAVNQTATIDLALHIGEVRQTITVEAQGVAIETATSELGTVLGEKPAQNLPLNGRNFSAMLTLTPGASPIDVAQNKSGGNIAILPGAAFSFPALNGQTNRSNMFLLDGLNDQEAEGSEYAYPPIIDQVEQFKVNSHNDQAQFGGVLGGVVNVVTKSGTNDFHGSAWEFARNDIFDAVSPLNISKVVYHQNQFGGSLGGPVRIPKLYNGKNRTFFFIASEGFIYSTQLQSYYRVPTAAQLSGDFSAVSTQLYNPYSTYLDPAKPGYFARNPFPNNQIPITLLDKGAVAFAKAVLPPPVSIPGQLGTVYNAVVTAPKLIDQQTYSARVDESLGSRDLAWFRYSGLQYSQSVSGGIANLTSTSTNPTSNYGANWVHTFSPTFVLQAQYGRNYAENNKFEQFSVQNLNSIFGFTGELANPYLSGETLVPNLVVTGYWSGGEVHSPTPYASDVHQFKVALTKTLGSHILGWGAEWSKSDRELYTENSSETFTSTPTGNPENSSQPGDALASLLLSVPTAAQWRNTHGGLGFGGEGAVYFQDQWKALNRLTINLGLRYDLTVIPPAGNPAIRGELGGGPEVGEMDYSNGTYIVQVLPPPCSVAGHAPCIPGSGALPAHVVVAPGGKLLHNTPTNVGPRVGMAYRLSPTIAVRAGFGIVFDNWAGITQLALNAGSGTWPNLGAQLASSINSPTPTQPTPTLTAEDPFAAGNGLLPAANPYNQGGYFVDPHIKNAYSEQWNLDIEKQVGRNTAISVGYVGSEQHRLDEGGIYNVALTPGPGNPSARSPWPYLGAENYDFSGGSGDYHALELSINRHYSEGLSYQVAYTWAKGMDDGNSGWFGVEGFYLQDPYNLKGSRSVSAFDIGNQLTVNGIYEIPIGAGQPISLHNRVLDALAEHWQTSAIFIARSGQPYTIMADGDIANTGNSSYMRANIVGNPNLSHPTPAQWFNTAAFQIPAPYTFGNLGRNTLRSQGYWNLDMSLFRRIPIHREKADIEIRAEAFNLMNTVIYGIPGADISTPSSFGHVTSQANSPRVLQLGVRCTF